MNRYRFLSRSEERTLLKKAKRGDIDAANRLVESVMPYIIKQSGRWIRKCRGLEVEDLISEGVIAARRAVEKYDLSRDVRFITYCGFWLHEAYQRMRWQSSHVNTCAVIQRHGIGRIMRAHRSGTLADVIPNETRRNAVLAVLVPKTVYLDATTVDDGNSEWLSIDAEQQDGVDNRKLADRVRAALSTLDKREREIIRRRFFSGDGDSLADVAPSFGLSRERIRQLEDRALDKLARELRDIGREWFSYDT